MDISKNRKVLIAAYETGYRVTKDGIPLNQNKEKIKGGVCYHGYKVISIRTSEGVRKVAVHRLQAYQKYGEKMFNPGIEVRHKDNDKTNNSFKNILIGTHSENMMDIPPETRLKRSLHASSFNKRHSYKKIKDYYHKHKSYLKTMKEFNISSKGTLHYIINN